MTHPDFDEIMQDAARTYREPPIVPREAMWQAIERGRADVGVVPVGGIRTLPRILAYAAGIAAVLVTGIVIGRATRDPAQLARVTLPALTQPETTAVATALPFATPDESSAAPVERAGRSPRAAAHVAASRRAATPDFSGDDAAWRMAVTQHLARTEILLTSFGAQTRSVNDRKLDAQFASSTRDLLGTTRMMLTHRNSDPTMTRLLEDLELVLMQISQYATDGRRVDLDAATQSIDKRNVITKLRSSIPAGS